MFLHTGALLLQQPLFNNAPISVEASIYTTYLYAIRNKLSYEVTTQLLDLMRIHFPSPNFYPRSLHLLRKHLNVMSLLKCLQFCSECYTEVPEGEKHCSMGACRCTTLSYYVVLPFEEHIASLFCGKL